MNKRDRLRKPSRREPFVNPKRLVLIISEGMTERDYFAFLAKSNSKSIFKFEPQAGVPMSVVRRAEELAELMENSAQNESDANNRFDEVYLLFDVDEHPNVENAKRMAAENMFITCISNPCFELWLYLHFNPPPGIQSRETFQKIVKESLPGFEKRLTESHYRLLVPNQQGALDKSKVLERLLASETLEIRRNPTTGAGTLFERMQTENTEDE